MASSPEGIEERASEYASRRGGMLEHRLGYGKDGTVFQTSMSTAVKVFARSDVYARELACYRHLLEHDVEEIQGHAVPRLIGWNDELLVIEMEIVTRPYLLDFADAFLDEPPDFPDEVWEHWYEQKQEQFGEQWEEVQIVLAVLRGQYGICLLDINPGNITFGETEA